MACLITDADLNVLAEGPKLVIHQSNEVLEKMSDWCKEHHSKSGLTEAVRKSTISLKEAEQIMLQFIQKHTPKNCCPLAGNSIQEDRSFLQVHMPKFFDHLHYRIVDVSTVKELCRRWYPVAFHNAPKKKRRHR
jgi:oligoribonuclease